MGAARKSKTKIEAKAGAVGAGAPKPELPLVTSIARERFGAFADDIFLTEREAAQIIGLSPNTLKSWRLNGSAKGPPVTKVYSAVRYRVGGLRRWLSRFPDSDVVRAIRHA
jgi:hypothetical protein